MKILQLISSSGFFGAESVVLQLSRALRTLDVTNVIGVFENPDDPGGGLAEEAAKNELEVERFPCGGKLDWRTLRALRKGLHEGGFHILHSHGYKADIYALLSATGRDVKLVSTCHNWIGGGLRMEAYYWIQKKILRRFDRVVGVSDAVLQELGRIGVPQENRTLIRNGIDLTAFAGGRSLKSDFGLGTEDCVIGSVGRLSEEKGLRDLLRVAERVCKVHSNVFFLLVGDGPLRKELEDLSRRLGLDGRVIFAGQRRDMCDIYRTLDLLLLTSYTEGLPMVLLEAMASSVPIVASGVGGVLDLIEDGKNGTIVGPGDLEGFAGAIMAMIEDRTWAREAGKKGNEVAREGFSSESMALRYLEVYERLAGEGKRGRHV